MELDEIIALIEEEELLDEKIIEALDVLNENMWHKFIEKNYKNILYFFYLLER